MDRPTSTAALCIVLGALGMLSACDGADETPLPDARAVLGGDLAAQRAFARCLARGTDCVARIPDSITDADPSAGIGPATEPNTALVNAALDYLDAEHAFEAAPSGAMQQNLQADVQGTWLTLVASIERSQAAAVEAGAWSCAEVETTGRNTPGCAPSIAAMRLVEPLSGEALETCGRWAGNWSAETRVGSPTEAEQMPNVSLTFAIECPQGQDCAGSGRYSAIVELAAAGGPDGIGTGLDRRLSGVNVNTHGNLLLFHAPPALGPPGVLFAVLFDCAAGIGLLQWGSLAPDLDWPEPL